MLEKALTGSRRYWAFVAVLLLCIAAGLFSYLQQFREGLTVTGLSRDVPWGLYISQFTFLVGVAASAVILVLPYYLHDFKAFGKIVVLGEYLAIAAVIMCMLFIFVDMGMPTRVTNVALYTTPHSLMFWDMVVLAGYLGLNVVIARISFGAELKGVPPPKWIRPVIILSIPWAVSIHTVTAFLYSGLGARPFWMTAVLAPRFLASAFASGPALLILICLLLRKVTRFDAGDKAIQKLGTIVVYAMLINLFLVAMEFFTVFYSAIPEHMHHFEYLFAGHEGHGKLVPLMWLSMVLGVLAALLLLFPAARRTGFLLVLGCIGVIVSIWIDKGLGMVTGGFVPTPLGAVTEYSPTGTEILIALGVYAVGALILTVLYKVAVTQRELRGA
jgi:molybdopterin-containing oxidoreductase family membrane subunit